MPTIGGRAGFAGTTVVYCWEGHQAPSLSGRLVLADKGRMRPSRSSAVTIALGLGELAEHAQRDVLEIADRRRADREH